MSFTACSLSADGITWTTTPTQAMADAERWVLDPVYAAAEGFANPYHIPSDYGTQDGGAAFGLYPGLPTDLDADTIADDIEFGMTWFRGGYIEDVAGPVNTLMATIRVVSDLGPNGTVSFSAYSSGTANFGPVVGPGVAPPGDFDGDAHIDDLDIDMLCDAIRTGSTNFDLFDISADGATEGQDGVIDLLDLDFLVHYLVETAVGNGTEYGDFNLDGKLDTTDLTRLATNYGPNDWKWADGNANRNIDTNIDNTDLTILATYYGTGPADPDVVPEPATAGLLLLGASAVLRRRRKT